MGLGELQHTFGINSLDFISGFTGLAGTKSVQGSDSVGVPLTLGETCHLELSLRDQVPAGLPLVSSPLAAVNVVASDTRTSVVLWRLPSQEDATG